MTTMAPAARPDLPSRRTLGRAGALVVAALAPAFAAMLVAGTSAFVLVFLATLLSAAAVLALGTRAACRLIVAVVFLAAGAATVGSGQPVALGLLVGGAAVVTGAAVHRSSRVVGMAPIVVLMCAMLPTHAGPVETTAWLVLGAAWALVFATLAGLRAPARPVPLAASVVYTCVLAASCGISAFIVADLDLPRAYWLVVTLSVLVKPTSGDTIGATRTRIAGTLVGALVALLASLILPPLVAVIAAVSAAGLTFAFMLSGEILPQIASLTVMVVLLTATAAGANVVVVDAQRIGWTLVGAVIAVALALAVARVTAMLGMPEATSETPTDAPAAP